MKKLEPYCPLAVLSAMALGIGGMDAFQTKGARASAKPEEPKKCLLEECTTPREAGYLFCCKAHKGEFERRERAKRKGAQ